MPLESVAMVCRRLVAPLITVTRLPDTSAPCESVTVPEMLPPTPAQRLTANTVSANTRTGAIFAAAGCSVAPISSKTSSRLLWLDAVIRKWRNLVSTHDAKLLLVNRLCQRTTCEPVVWPDNTTGEKDWHLMQRVGVAITNSKACI